ncbi:MAG: hypothetical protein ACXWL2_04465 [Candidatus Chromulinivorax sp.]
MNKFLLTCCIILSSLPLLATHYVNKTGRIIKITNVTAKKRLNKKNYFNWFNKKNKVQDDQLVNSIYFIDLENGQEGDLDNQQDDQITITSDGMSDKRILFPSNNAFNYVITMNKYKAKYEKFDINHADNIFDATDYKKTRRQLKKMQKNNNE